MLKWIAQEGRNTAIDLVKRRLDNMLPENLARLDASIKEKGYVIVPDFITASECEKIKGQMDFIIDTNDKIWKDPVASDNRIFFSNKASEEIDSFFHDKMITSVLSSYEKINNYKGFTLANKIVY